MDEHTSISSPKRRLGNSIIGNRKRMSQSSSQKDIHKSESQSPKGMLYVSESLRRFFKAEDFLKMTKNWKD